MNNYPPGVTAHDIVVDLTDYLIDEPATRSDNLPCSTAIRSAIKRSKRADERPTAGGISYGEWFNLLGPTAQSMDTRWLMEKYKRGWSPSEVDDRIRDYSD